MWNVRNHYLMLVSLLPSIFFSGLATAQTCQHNVNSVLLLSGLPRYDVVSVREARPSASTFDVTSLDDGLLITNASMPELIRQAYNLFDLSEAAIGDLPPWALQERFNLSAKVGADSIGKFKALSMGKRYAMLLPTLEERFGLKLRCEVVPGRVLTLEVANAKRLDSSEWRDGTPGLQQLKTYPGSITATKIPLHLLAVVLSSQLSQPVADGTDAAGRYFSFILNWTPLDTDPSLIASGSIEDVDIQGELRDKLGLKLTRHKGFLDHIRVVSVLELTPN